MLNVSQHMKTICSRLCKVTASLINNTLCKSQLPCVRNQKVLSLKGREDLIKYVDAKDACASQTAVMLERKCISCQFEDFMYWDLIEKYKT